MPEEQEYFGAIPLIIVLPCILTSFSVRIEILERNRESGPVSRFRNLYDVLEIKSRYLNPSFHIPEA